MAASGSTVIELDRVSVHTAKGAYLLRDLTWRVRGGEHWAVLGPNGAGKTTLLSVAGASRHPSAGTASVLGQRLGRVDVRELRARIGVVDQGPLPGYMTAELLVLTGATATLQPLWDRYTAEDRARARELLELVGCAHLAGRPFGTCSQGERARIRIARALMPAPRLLLLDEPATGLDLAARELLLATLDSLAAAEPALATVTVAHHVEDLPSCTSHALLLRAGEQVAAGPAAEVLTGGAVARCFGVPVTVERRGGRWLAVAAAPAAAGGA